MTEVSFAKQFLTALEARPARLSSDHVVDPKSYLPQSAFILPRTPQPKRKPTRPTTSSTTDPSGATSSEQQQQPASEHHHHHHHQPQTATVTLKPTRPTLPTHTLPAPVPVATTSIHDLKAAYAAAAGLGPGGADRIKILYAKKPVSDVKTVKEILPAAALEAGDAISVELSVMVMGGGAGAGAAAAAAAAATAATPAISTPERVASPSQAEVEMGEAPVAEKPNEAAEILRTDAFWADMKGFLVQRLKDEAEGERLVGVFREAFQKSSGAGGA